MTIPKYDELFIPILNLLKEHGEIRAKEFVKPLGKSFDLSDEALNKMYPSGNGPIFYDRVSWALSYLSMSGIVDKPKRGLYKINTIGLDLELVSYMDKKLTERDALKTGSQEITSSSESDSDLTPQEQLYVSYEDIRQSIYDDILNTILNKSPRDFEHIVVQLLEKMGYGGQLKNAGTVTQASNDGGIDGVIKEDVLGLGQIHIQAKRYSRDNTVGREEIQKFVGALAVAQSSKGVFITTSSYSKGAVEYAGSLNTNATVVLIDGYQLAKYIYDYDLGMQTEQTFKIKKLDSDFWDTMQDV